MRNQVETQKERSQLASIPKKSMHYFSIGGRGGGGLSTIAKRFSCSKSNSNTFCGSPGMHNEVETQMERSKWISIPKKRRQFCFRGGGDVGKQKKLRIFLFQTQFQNFWRVPWDTQSSRNTKITMPMDFNSKRRRQCCSRGAFENNRFATFSR